MKSKHFKSEHSIVPLYNTNLSQEVIEPFIRHKKDFFSEFSKLIKKTEDEILDECYLFEIKEIMKRTGKVVVRYAMSEEEMENVLLNASLLSMEEILISPAYIENLKKQVKKNKLENQMVSSIIDFPFGESLFKSKVSDIKSCMSLGVDFVTVMLPSIYFKSEKSKLLKREIKKIRRISHRECGIAVDCSELNEESIKRAIKTINKYQIKFIDFVFGDIAENVFNEKIGYIAKNKEKSTVKVLANIKSAEEIISLLKKGIDIVLTPFADEIGKDLIKRFEIEKIKLK